MSIEKHRLFDCENTMIDWLIWFDGNTYGSEDDAHTDGLYDENLSNYNVWTEWLNDWFIDWLFLQWLRLSNLLAIDQCRLLGSKQNVYSIEPSPRTFIQALLILASLPLQALASRVSRLVHSVGCQFVILMAKLTLTNAFLRALLVRPERKALFSLSSKRSLAKVH